MAKARTSPSRAQSGAQISADEVLEPVIPGEIQSLLGRPPLLPGEDRSTYDRLMVRVSQALRPSDTMEWLFVEDVVYATQSLHNLRLVKQEIQNDGLFEALRQALTEFHRGEGRPPNESQTTAKAEVEQFIEAPDEYRSEFNKMLTAVGASFEMVAARGMALRLEQIQAVDHMISIELARREAALREADRWRNGLGRRLKAATEDIIDVDPVTGES